MSCWKSVVGFEGLYDVSDAGEVRNAAGDVINPVLDKNGYRKIGLSKDRTRSMHSVHRLVAIAFIQNPDGKLCVTHVNGIASDNSAANLRWATKMENNRNRKISKANTTGFKGVSFDKQTQKYRAQIKITGNTVQTEVRN